MASNKTQIPEGAPAPLHSYAQQEQQEKVLLLVNEDLEKRYVLRGILGKGGYQHVIESESGSEALHHLRTDNIAILITDIDLPDMDGWRLIQMIRSGACQCRHDLPIIAVSSVFRDKPAESRAEKYRINACLPLPLQDPASLIDAVSSNCTSTEQESSNPKLLIVEDDLDTALLARQILRRQYRVEVCTNGEAGLKAWRNGQHDLVLLDVMLPKMSGIEVLQKILAKRPGQAVVIMTSDATMYRSEPMMFPGAADFISKPFQARQLRETCAVAIQRKDKHYSAEEPLDRLNGYRANENKYRRIAEAHQRLLDNLGNVVFELDNTARIVFLNKAWNKMLGYAEKKALHAYFYSFVRPQERTKFRSVIERMAAGQLVHYEDELPFVSSESKTVWCQMAIDAKKNDNGAVDSLFGYLTDVTEKRLAQQQLAHMAAHDAVTGLYNRNYLEKRLEKLSTRAKSGKASHALLYIDLDHFKIVNDKFSHREGDNVLRDIAELLTSCLCKDDTLYRIGGDEFAVVIENVDNATAIVFAHKILKHLSEYCVNRKDIQLSVGGSIGIAIIDGSLPSGTDYLIQAGKASFVAKKRGRNRAHVYNPTDKESDELWQSIDWANRLREAISENRLELYLQPIFDITTGVINHYEALLRLQLPNEKEIVLPDTFIPAVERAGQIHSLDRWVIRQAFYLLSSNAHIGQIAINLSGQAFADLELVANIEEGLASFDVDPRRIIFEITETASISNFGESRRMINELRAIGCRFALDDFGTGFCSFNYLKHLPADFVKLDGSYIKNIMDNDLDLAMVRSMNEIAHVLGKKTIAECVESDVALQVLKDVGVDYIQGFSVGHPAPLANLATAARVP